MTSLNALRAFDSVARHLSFTKAAVELGVTQAAVSSQIRALEDRLQFPLFTRSGRKITLTARGNRLHRETEHPLRQVAEALDGITYGERDPIVVTLTPSFASRWVLPRLGEFHLHHPDIDIHLSPSNELAEGRLAPFDLAIRWGRGRWPGLVAEFLTPAPMTVVCSPRLLEGDNEPLREPKDLARFRLLHERNTVGWQVWLKTAGVDHLIDGERGLVLADPSLLDSAAIAGMGVALGRPNLLRRQMRENLLVQPFDITVPTSKAYYVVYRPGALRDSRVKAFHDFLMSEIQRESSDG